MNCTGINLFFMIVGIGISALTMGVLFALIVNTLSMKYFGKKIF